MRLDTSETQIDDKSDNLSEMSSDIKDSSMIEIFNRNIVDDKDQVKQTKMSVLEVEILQSNPSMIEINKFKTFNDEKSHKRTIIENSSRTKLINTRNKSKDNIDSNFNSHTIQ